MTPSLPKGGDPREERPLSAQIVYLPSRRVAALTGEERMAYDAGKRGGENPMRNTANVESDTVRRYILAEVVGAASRVSEAEAEAEVARKVRDDMIRRAKAQGVTLSELAALTGLSRARVQQVAPVEHDDETKVDLPEESATSAVSAG